MSGERVDPDGYVVEDFPLTGLLEATPADSGFVIRPGDLLILSADRGADVGLLSEVRQQLRVRLPALADVIVLGGGVRIAGVYRDADNSEVVA